MKRLRWILCISYCFFVVWITILKRTPTGIHEVRLKLLWSYRSFFSGAENGSRVVIQNLQNIIFFIPFGVLIPVRKWWIAGLAALILSLGVEITQYVCAYGLAELDDVICNLLGAVIGYSMIVFLKKLRVSKK